MCAKEEKWQVNLNKAEIEFCLPEMIFAFFAEISAGGNIGNETHLARGFVVNTPHSDLAGFQTPDWGQSRKPQAWSCQVKLEEI